MTATINIGQQIIFMILETEHGGQSTISTAAEITQRLNHLDGYAILGPDEYTYMQASGSPGETYTLEYQEGSLDRHFVSETPVDEATMIRAFVNYFQQNPEWKSSIVWETMDL